MSIADGKASRRFWVALQLAPIAANGLPLGRSINPGEGENVPPTFHAHNVLALYRFFHHR